MLNFSKKEQPEERIIPKTFCRSFKFMLNFQLLSIWDLTNIPFSSDGAGTPLDQFGKLDHHVSNRINPFLTGFTSLLFESKQIRDIHNF